MRILFFNKKVLFMSIARLTFTIVYKIACQFFDRIFDRKVREEMYFRSLFAVPKTHFHFSCQTRLES